MHGCTTDPLLPHLLHLEVLLLFLEQIINESLFVCPTHLLVPLHSLVGFELRDAAPDLLAAGHLPCLLAVEVALLALLLFLSDTSLFQLVEILPFLVALHLLQFVLFTFVDQAPVAILDALGFILVILFQSLMQAL